MLAAHWDTRWVADKDPDKTVIKNPIDGANDGASGVAVLLELARLFQSTTPNVGVDLVFFDNAKILLFTKSSKYVSWS